MVDWAKLPGVPATLKVVTSAPGAHEDDDIIIRRIDQAASQADFVVVDLEGRATGLAGYAIAISDFVIILIRGSNPDAKQAFRHMGLLKTQERSTNRAIPFAMLFTQTSPALQPKTQRFIERRLADPGAPVFETQLVAYRGRPEDIDRNAGIAGMLRSGMSWSSIQAAIGVAERRSPRSAQGLLNWSYPESHSRHRSSFRASYLGVHFCLAPETPSVHSAIMADAPKFSIDVAQDADRQGRYRWRIFEDRKLRDRSLHSFATKREAQIDADKFVARLNDIWKTPR